MAKERKEYLLRGLTEYYKNRHDILTEETDNNTIVETINGLPHIVLNTTIEEWSHQNNAVNIDDIQWQR